MAWTGLARLGETRPGKPGKAGTGFGKAGRGRKWTGEARPGKAGKARLGVMGIVKVGRGKAGKETINLENQMLNQRIIEKELRRIQKKYGALTPPAIVKESRPEKAVLHHRFTWDDSKAAHQHRLWEARQIVQVVSFLDPKMDTPVRSFQSVTMEARDEEGQIHSTHIYVDTREAFKNPALRAQILARAHREAADFAVRYKSLVELAEIISVIKKVVPGLPGK
jgi:hypothetical protein